MAPKITSLCHRWEDYDPWSFLQELTVLLDLIIVVCGFKSMLDLKNLETVILTHLILSLYSPCSLAILKMELW